MKPAEKIETVEPESHRLNLRVLRYRSDPGRDEPVTIAQELITQGRFGEAIDLTEKSLEKDPSDVDLLLTHAVALRESGDLNTAQLALTRAAKAEPHWVEPWRLLAHVLWDRGKVERAHQVATKALELDPNDAHLREIHRVGALEARAHRYLDGDRDADDPAMLAQELLSVNRAETAFEVTRSALLEELDDEDLLVTHARAARARGDLDEAIGALETASFEAPDYAEVWRLLAISYEERGETDRARQAAASGVLNAPGNRTLHELHERLELAGQTLVTL